MPAGPPTILWPITGSIIYHHQPVIQADFDAGYWWFSRSSIGSPWDNYTVWRMVPEGMFNQIVYFVLVGLSGFKTGFFGDGNWKVDCAGSSNGSWGAGNSSEWSSYGIEAQFLPFQYQPVPPDPVPIASFSNSPKEFFEAKTVQFNDSSSGNPTSWSWKYRVSDSNNAWVEFSTLQNPTKNFSV